MNQQKKSQLKIILLGNVAVGKTTILQKYNNPQYDGSQVKTTISSDFMKKEIVVDSTSVTLQLWDTAGQERFESLGFAFYRGTDACGLVFDIGNRESFDAIDQWYQAFLDNAHPSDKETFPVLLIGNKSDLSAIRQVERAEAEQWCRDKISKSKVNIIYHEISALNNLGVGDVFEELARGAM